MPNLPLVSIITPSYNQAQFIRETIESVILQRRDYPNIEHIVIDGGSTDGTIRILREYCGEISWVSEPDRGQSDAFNKGLARAHGEFIGWINADDYYLPGAIYLAVERLLARPEAAVVYGDIWIVDSIGARRHLGSGRPFSLETMLLGNHVNQPGAIIRTNALRSVGGLDPTLHYAMDYQLWLKLGLEFELDYLPVPLACFRFHESSKTISQPERFCREDLWVREQFFQSENLLADLRAIEQSAYAVAHARGMAENLHVGNIEIAREHFEQLVATGLSLAPSVEAMVLGSLWHNHLGNTQPSDAYLLVREFLRSMPRNTPLIWKAKLGAAALAGLAIIYARCDHRRAAISSCVACALIGGAWWHKRTLSSVLVQALICKKLYARLRGVPSIS